MDTFLPTMLGATPCTEKRPTTRTARQTPALNLTNTHAEGRARARNASPARPTLQKISLVTWWVAPFNEREAATVAAVSATDTVTATSAALAAHRWA